MSPGMYWEPVSIPLAGGLDLKNNPKAVPNGKLTGLLNGVFTHKGSVSSRSGYDRIDPVLGMNPPESAEYPPNVDYIYGYGEFDGVKRRRLSFSSSRIRNAAGLAVNDDALLMAGGGRLYAQTQNTWVDRGDLHLPRVAMKTVAQYTSKQTHGDFASTGLVDVVCWRDNVLGVAYSVYDTETGACVVPATALPTTPSDPGCVRLVALGHQVLLFVSDDTANNVRVWRVYDRRPTEISGPSVFAGSTTAHFDVTKISETEGLLVYVLGAGGAAATYFNAMGGTNLTPAPANTAIGNGGYNPVGPISVAVQPFTRDVCVIWHGNNGADHTVARVFDAGFVALGSTQVLGAVAPHHVTVAAEYLLDSSDASRFIMWRDEGLFEGIPSGLPAGDALVTTCHRVSGTGAAVQVYERLRVHLTSKAFRIGNKTFVHMGRPTALQSSYMLLDSDGHVWGSVLRGTAELHDHTETTGWLPTVQPVEEPTEPNVLRVRFCAGFKVRIPPILGGREAVYTDPGLKLLGYTFGGPLISAQAGRSTYMLGCGLVEYDGEAVYEQGFLLYPEEGYVFDKSVGGDLTDTGVYSWRCYYTYRNAKGERSRSAALTFTTSAIAAPNKTANLRIPTLTVTDKPGDVVIEVFRTKANGTVFYRESSLDPTSVNYVANDITVNEVNFESQLSDDELGLSEIDPYTSRQLDAVPAPAGSVLGVGKGRVWLAGGDITPGSVVYSKLMVGHESPAFNEALESPVDRNAGDVVALGAAQESMVVLTRNKVYAMDGNGPDNQGIGSFAWLPREVPADTGAISPVTADTVMGLVYQSAQGLRAVGPGWQVIPFGTDVDPAAGGEVTAMVVVPNTRQLRILMSDDLALVFDLEGAQWSQFTNHESPGGVYWAARQRFAYCKADGTVLVENPGSFLDGGAPFDMVVTTAVFHAAGLGSYQRVRRAGLVGTLYGDPVPLKLQVQFDEENIWHDCTWSGAEAETSAWGSSATWGSDAFWGQATTFKGRALRLRTRLPRQKCSSVRFRIRGGAWATGTGAPESGERPPPAGDAGSVIVPGFSSGPVGNGRQGYGLSELTLEIGKKRGLHRLAPARS